MLGVEENLGQEQQGQGHEEQAIQVGQVHDGVDGNIGAIGDQVELADDPAHGGVLVIGLEDLQQQLQLPVEEQQAEQEGRDDEQQQVVPVHHPIMKDVIDRMVSIIMASTTEHRL